MKRFINAIINKFFIKNPLKPLGRWNIEYCSKKLERKIDLSNEDHCGPCGEYRITKINKPVIKINNPVIKKDNNLPPIYMPPKN
jgi:hypothetical protein